MNSAV